MHGSITDWRGELQVRALVGAALRLALRYPVATLIWPAAAVALAQSSDLESVLLSVVPFGLLNQWTAAAVHPSVLVALPLIALAWVRIARVAARPTRQRPRLRLRAWTQGTAIAVAAGGLVLAASDALGTWSLLVVALFATFVPAQACDPREPGLGWRLMSGHRWRWIGAWLLVHAALAGIFLVLFGLTSAFAPDDLTSLRSLHRVHPSLDAWVVMVDVGTALTVVYEGLAIGLTLALSAATYAALRRRRDVDDAQRWLEALD